MVLVVSHTEGFRHEDIPWTDRILAGLLPPETSVEFAETESDVVEKMAVSRLSQYDLIVFNNTTGDIGVPDVEAFRRWVREGNGFAAIHAAANIGDPLVRDMIGLTFQGHGRACEVELNVENRHHPAVSSLGDRWRVFDEIYLFRPHPDGPIRNRAEILLSLDRHPPDGSEVAGSGGDFPLAWCRQEGDGRIFYTALGHDRRTWDDPAFQNHLRGGLTWARGEQD